MPKGMRVPGLVIEIGCVELLRTETGWTKGATWRSLVRPDAPIRPDSIKVHGIRPTDLNGAPRFAEIADALLDFYGDSLIVAHAFENERDFLNYEFRRMGRIGWDERMFTNDRFICTQELSEDVFPKQSGSLDALCRRLWVDDSARTTHGALLDADLTADAFIKFAIRDIGEKSVELD